MRIHGSLDGLSRRGFGALLTAAAGVSELSAQQSPATPPAAPAAAPRRPAPPPDVPPFDGPIQFARKDAPVKAQPFPMAQVRLLP